jgi:hypothetical protein
MTKAAFKVTWTQPYVSEHATARRAERPMAYDPTLLAPILTRLSTTFPYPINSILISVVTESLRVYSALYTSLQTFTWEPQNVLPPLISLIFAYFALLSIWRATSWMLRLGFWLVKWGVFVGAVVALIGLVVGEVGKVDLDAVLPGRWRTPKRPPRPKPWHSFQLHQQWATSPSSETKTEFTEMVERVYHSIQGEWGKVVSRFDGGKILPSSSSRSQDQKKRTRTGKRTKVR